MSSFHDITLWVSQKLQSTQRDWAWGMGHGEEVTCLAHAPRVGAAIPLQTHFDKLSASPGDGVFRRFQ